MAVELLEEDREFAVNIADLHDIEETGFSHVELARQGRQIDWSHVDDLINSDISKWDPILITKTSIGYVLLGGYHRREAAKKRKRPQVTELRAICKTFTAERDVINAVFEDNARTGLKPGAQTKSDHAYFLWVAFPGITHKDIGLKVGLSRSGVSHAVERKATKAAEKTEQPAGEPVEAPDITDLPKKQDAGAVTEKARQEKGIAPVIRPGTQPDEEKQRQEIIKAANALSDDSQRLLEYLQRAGADKLRAAGITATLEAVHKRLEEGIHIIDDVLRPQPQETEGTETPGEE
jgi:hypothetical protein